MKRSKIAKAMDYIDEDLLAEAVEGKSAVQTKRTRSVWGGVGAAAVASVVLVVGGIVLSQVVGDADPVIGSDGGNTVIALDVNPSMEIEVNDAERVVEVRALNADAETVLADLELENASLEVAMDEIIGSLWAQAYLSAEQNSILISVDTLDAAVAAKWQDSVLREVEAFFAEKGVEPCVLTQSFEKSDSSNSIAQRNDISMAKATLVEKILDAKIVDIHGIPYTDAELSAMKINELKLMLDAKELAVEGLGSKGEPSAQKFLDAKAALTVAYEHAQVAEGDIVEYEIALEFDHRAQSMFYEVEFETVTTEYEYDIHAESGEILSFKSEATEDDEDDDEHEIPPLPEGFKSADEALAVAYAAADVLAEDVREVECKYKESKGWCIFLIEFEVKNVEYAYTVDAATGDILFSRVKVNEVPPENEGEGELPPESEGELPPETNDEKPHEEGDLPLGADEEQAK